MSGKPDGIVAAPLSRTAILAAVAAAAAWRGPSERQDFAEEHGLELGNRDIYRALELRKRPAGPKAPDDPDLREWAWDSMEVDTFKLGLDMVVAWLPRPSTPGRRRNHAKLLKALRATNGVLAINDCYDDTVLVHALAADPQSKRRLQSRLEELCPEVLWAEVRQVDHEQPGRGWLHIAKEVAGAENRLKPPRASKKATSA